MIKNYVGHAVDVDKNGYFTDPRCWNPEIALILASEEGMTLTEKHIRIIIHLRHQYFNGESLSIRKINHSGIVTLKEFYELFHGAPLKTACKIAGLPNPESCV